ncbi:unnamed protein product [Ixodes hexagonus]
MDEKLKAERDVISSLLVACQGNPTVSQFLNDYRQTEGRQLPFREYGCGSVMEFFGKIQDTVRIIEQSYGEPIICLKVNEKLRHIDNLVKTQKKSVVKRATRGRFTGTRQFTATRRPPVVRRPQPQTLPTSSQRDPTLTSQRPQKGVGVASPVKPVEWRHFTASDSSKLALPSPVQKTRSVDSSCQTDPEASLEITDSPSVSLDCEGPLTCREEENNFFRQKLHFAAGTSSNIVEKWQAINAPPMRTSYAPVKSSPRSMPTNFARVQAQSLPSCTTVPAGSPWGAVPVATTPIVLSPPQYTIHNNFFLSTPTVPPSYTICQNTQHLGLNPYAAEYVPETHDYSGTELQAEKIPKLVDQCTSTADLSGAVNAQTSTEDLSEGISDDMVEKIDTLLRTHPSGLKVEELLSLCRLEIGKDSYVEKERGPLGLAQALLASMSSISIECFEPGKFVVRSLEGDTSPRTGEEEPSVTIPREVAHGFTSILLRYPDGLDTKELLNEYRKHFGPHRYLDRASQNTANFACDLLVGVPSMTVTSKGEGTYMVSLSTKGGQFSSGRDKDSRAVGPGSSVDESDTSEDEDSFDLQELPPTQEFLVIIGEVFNPTEFYILSLATVGKLQSMMMQLDKFYSTAPLTFYSVNRKDLKLGYLCAAPYMIHGKPVWHRAVVTYVKAPKVCVRYIDYGTVNKVKIEELRRLCSNFMELPAQGIRASLANLRPKGSSTWPVEANRRFLTLTKSTGLSCTVVERRQDIVVIELTTALDSAPCSISDVLVEEGFAERVPQYIESHLLAGDYDVKMVVWNNVRYMTAAGISKLFGWEGDQTKCSLKLQDLVLPSTFKTCPTMFVGRHELPELYEQICENEGSLCMTDDIELYPLEQVPCILKLLGHPSKTLKREFHNLVDRSKSYSSEETTCFPDETAEEEEECYSILRRNGKRKDLSAKLESLMERRRDLRMRAYEEGDKEMLFQLMHVERQIDSVKSLLEEFDNTPSMPMSRQSMSTPSPVPTNIDAAMVSRLNCGDHMQQPSVSVSLQNKLMEMLISAKRGT